MIMAQWQSCTSQVVDHKSLMTDSLIETTQWQTCGSKVVEDKSLIADNMMEMVRIEMPRC
jgi:hypothetical protein